jgi:hypothetical protein
LYSFNQNKPYTEVTIFIIKQGVKMKISFIAILLLALSGCANTGTSEQLAKNDTTESEKGYQCEKVYVLGSTIPKKLCSNAAERKALERKSKAEARNTRRPIVSTHKDGI